MGPPRPAARAFVDTQAGPVGVEVHGFAGGLTNSEITRLVKAGMKQSCPGRAPSELDRVAGPSLSIIWEVVGAGVRPPAVIITGRLLNNGHQVSFAFDRTLPPDTSPDVVFEYAISGVTCALFRKAGFLVASPGKSPANPFS